jgi:MFS family permease
MLPPAATVFIACVAGWLIMQLEILGARVLVPVFGGSIFVTMGSVIGVFLLSMSIGYMLGGWFSGTRHSELALGLCLAVAGAWLCAVPFLARPVCNGIVAGGFSDTWGSLLAGFILFGLPTILLGTVSPTAARWLTRQAGQSGRSAGLVLAFSTAASFAGCVVTAFYLVLLSVRRTILVSGVVLIALGGMVVLRACLARRRGRRCVDASGVPDGGSA